MMGTTVTPNLGLIKPDLNESIKENLPTFPGWATQNAQNMETVDRLFRNNTNFYGLTWTGSSGDPVVGTGGFVEGKYVRLGPRMVLVYFRIAAGTTGFTVGAGVYRLSIPFPASPQLDSVNDGIAIGRAYFYDASANNTSTCFTVTYNPDAGNLYLTPPTGGAWSPTSPVAIAQSDRCAGYFLYPTDAA